MNLYDLENSKRFRAKKPTLEGLADEFMALAKAKGYNPRMAGTPDEERARTDAMMKQRAADRDAQEKQAGQADAANLPELKAEYEAMKQKYEALGGSNWQYADREQNLSDREREARSMEPQLRNLGARIARAEKSQGMGEARRANTAAARAELSNRPRKPGLSPAEQDKAKADSDASWERLMAYADEQKKKEQGVEEAKKVASHSELAKSAHEAYIAAVRSGNSLMANHYKKAYEKHKRLAASERKSIAKGVTEGGFKNLYAEFSGYGNYMQGRAVNVFKKAGLEIVSKEYTEDDNIQTYVVKGDRWAIEKAGEFLERNPEQFGGYHFVKQGVAEGSEDIGNTIRDLYQQIYDQGDDALEYLNTSAPLFSQYWDQYEGDLDSIIAEASPKNLIRIAKELQAVADQEGVTEVSDKTLTSYLTKVDADARKHQMDPTKRSAEKRSKSVAGFAKAFNKLDSRKPDGTLNEFAPGDGDDNGGDEDALFQYAKMWYSAPDVATQQQVEQSLAKIGWDIGELESEEGGAYVMRVGDEEGDSYIGWSEEELAGGMTEAETPESELERLKLRQNAEHGRAPLQRQAATQARIRELEKTLKGNKFNHKPDDWSQDFERRMSEGNDGFDTHIVMVTVTDPNATAVTQRKELRQRRAKVRAESRDAAVDYAIKWYRRQGYKVHDHHYVGAVRSGTTPNNEDTGLNELSNELLGRYKKELGVRASAADKAGDYDKGHEYFKKINKATIRQGENDARKHERENQNEMMETRLNMMRKAGYDL